MATLTASQKNRLFGRPGAVPAVNVTDRLPWLPRTSTGRVQVVLAHPLVADVFVEACHAAAKAAPHWQPQRVDSLVIRAWRNWKKPRGWKIGDRGTSDHSWGIAWDFFATPAGVAPPGGVWTPDNPVPTAFAVEFEKRGFRWGGRWTKRKDQPHIEYAGQPSVPFADEVERLTSMLKQGDVGSDVEDLQRGLMMLLGYSAPVSGIFGPSETTKVKEIQKLGGVKDDGVVGPVTVGVIKALGRAEFPTSAAMVTRGYQVIGRTPDAAGAAYWAGRVDAEGWLPDKLLRHMLAAIADDKSVDPGVVAPRTEVKVSLPAIATEADKKAIVKKIFTAADQIKTETMKLAGGQK